jgi:hypothetical protein
MKINIEKQPRTCAVIVNLTGGELMNYYPARKKGPLGRPKSRWVDNIKIDLREIAWSGRDWIDLAQDGEYCRAVNEHGNEPSGSIKC